MTDSQRKDGAGVLTFPRKAALKAAIYRGDVPEIARIYYEMYPGEQPDDSNAQSLCHSPAEHDPRTCPTCIAEGTAAAMIHQDEKLMQRGLADMEAGRVRSLGEIESELATPAASLDGTREKNAAAWMREQGICMRGNEIAQLDPDSAHFKRWLTLAQVADEFAEASRASDRERVEMAERERDAAQRQWMTGTVMFCRRCQDMRTIEDEGCEITCPVCDGEPIDYATVKIYSEQIDDLGQQVAALRSQKSSAESRVEQLQRELSEARKLYQDDHLALDMLRSCGGRIEDRTDCGQCVTCLKAQLSELTELLRVTSRYIHDGITVGDKQRADKLRAALRSHIEGM